MEFGCRYIYVDDPKSQNKARPESLQPPVTVPQSQYGVTLGTHFYDNFHQEEKFSNNAEAVVLEPGLYDKIDGAEGTRSDTEVNGLQHWTLSPESSVYQGLQPTSPMQLERQEKPPPLPQRRTKSLMFTSPVPEEPRCRVSPESNMYVGLHPPSAVNLYCRKTLPPPPPPLPPSRKNMCTDPGRPGSPTRNSAHYATINRHTEQQTTINIPPTTQNIPPPIPDRKKKPAYTPSDNTQPQALVYDYASCDSSGSNDLPQGANITPNGHNYLEILPATPEEVRMHATTVTERSMQSLPVLPTERLPANCNILLLNIGKMVDDSDNHIREAPLLCSRCSATCSSLNNVDNAKTWTCVFCAAENLLSGDTRFESREEGDDVYAGDPRSENEYSFADQTMIIFCIDISGSMSVTSEVTQEQSNDYNVVYKSRMEAVTSALGQTLDFLHQQHPGKRVALVTFSDQVKLYGDGTRQPQILEDAELLDPDYLKSQGEDQPLPHPLMETLPDLKGRIECLEEKGATALGPAALVSIAMASKSPGSKVIICTDGIANTDLGNLEDISEEYIYQSSKLFYSNLGDLALQHSVVVSVVTIEGTNCRLPELGLLADKTGGKVNIVNPFKLTNEFQSIVEEEIIATNVKMKVFLPQTMYFLYEGNNESVLERTFGSITADTVLSTEFGIHSSKIKEVLRNSQLPMQLHLSYTLPDGRSRRRVLSLRKPVTNDCAAALESIDLSVLQIHSVQFSARLAMEGHVNEARNVALELKELIDLVIMRQEKYEAYGVVYEDWENSMAPIYEDLQVYMKEKSSDKSDQDSHVEVHVVKTFSDEMAKMIFHMKRAKNKVLKKIRNQTE
ncbi:circularly permutated Ras protein 1-like [Ranitomeya variabilis]|uniref:circularly permutated Ras protein 1-like n=1 Tax=Ranitomeya variabilis TaxID=490064 RepID=UPI004056B8E3